MGNFTHMYSKAQPIDDQDEENGKHFRVVTKHASERLGLFWVGNFRDLGGSLDVGDEHPAEQDGEQSRDCYRQEVDLHTEETQSECCDESSRNMAQTINEAEKTKMHAFLLPHACLFAHQVDVPALTHPQKSRRQSAHCCSGACQQILDGNSHVWNKKSSREVESVCTGSDEHLCFDFPLAGRRVDCGEDEGHVADGYVSGANRVEVCLLVDVGEDSQEGVRGREENEKQQADLQSLFLRLAQHLHNNTNKSPMMSFAR